MDEAGEDELDSLPEGRESPLVQQNLDLGQYAHEGTVSPPRVPTPPLYNP